MKNRIIHKLAAAVAAITVLLTVSASAQTPAAISVSSFDDLRKIGRDPSFPIDGEYVLVRDIDASDSRVRPFVPIGTFDAPFSGMFYSRAGETFVIRNLYINRPGSGHAGLFGVLRYDAYVANVGVEADTVIGYFAAGTLAGTNNGRISNCYGTGVVAALRDQSNAGGLVGASAGEISGSYSVASVDGRENVGGLVGFLSTAAGGVVSQSFAGGSVRGENNTGGLIGHMFGGIVKECFSFAAVLGTKRGSVTGGLAGRDFAASALWNERGITLRDSAYVRAAEVSASYWDVAASGQASSAGGEGRRRAEMMSRTTFAEWDFDGVWSIVEGVHYPQLAAIPIYTRTLSYSVDSEERGRLRVLDMGAGGAVVDAYAYEKKQMFGASSFSVEALPWDGYRFVKWSDGFSGPVRVDTAFADLSLTAEFARIGGPVVPVHTFSYTAGAGGKIRAGHESGLAAGTGEFAVEGGAAGPSVAAVPDSGYRFIRWSDGNGSIVRTDRAAGDLALMAYFVKDSKAYIRLSNSDDLLFLSRGIYPLDGNYELAGDIDLSVSRHFEPVGTAAVPFSGVFRGNGYRIHGLVVNYSDSGSAGFFGCLENAQIIGVHVEAEIAGRGSAGLLAGSAVNTIIDSCVTAGAVRGALSVGGLAGYAKASLISRSASSAMVGGGESGAGGLTGIGAGSFIALSRFTGRVDGGDYAGGLAGRYDGGAVQHSYNAGSVNGRAAAGGLIGEVSGRAVLTRCYSSGSVVGMYLSAGGLVGTLGSDGGRAAACFWDIAASGRGLSALGTGKTPAEMKSLSTYAGWDFENVWGISGGAGYPWLREFPPGLPEIRHGPKQKMHSRAENIPRVRVAGRTMYVNAPAGAVLRVRLIDMKGRVAAGYDISGGARLPLRRVPSGKYVLEAAERGGPKNISTVILR
ncbi:MAG: hypothetical protein FWB85_07655 [Chitinispirillia bacterium]|nr:hypothetical protein [Chitinispirillia bacterium]MCL2242147.1 hypothetical protein [Chitinispirillia bacterium]